MLTNTSDEKEVPQLDYMEQGYTAITATYKDGRWTVKAK